MSQSGRKTLNDVNRLTHDLKERFQRAELKGRPKLRTKPSSLSWKLELQANRLNTHEKGDGGLPNIA